MTRPTLKAKKRAVIFFTTDSQFEILTLAAGQEEVSRSELIRRAIQEKTRRVLAGINRSREPVEAA